MSLASETENFRRAMQRRADTVQLVTYRRLDGAIEGMTATALCALSLTPPSILLCVGHTSRARDNIRRERAFGVSVLSTSQRALSASAGRTGGDKALSAELEESTDPDLVPVLSNAIATLQCKVVDDRDLFTHTVFVGEVLRAGVGRDENPLLHFAGSYAEVGIRLEP